MFFQYKHCEQQYVFYICNNKVSLIFEYMDGIKQRINSLREELNQHNYNYYVLSKPTISDYEFDTKMKELTDLENSNPEYYDPNSPSQRVGSDLTKTFRQVEHTFQCCL